LKRREFEVRRRAFDHYIMLAYHGDTKALRVTLLSGMPLSKEHRKKLAELIYRRIERKKRGRPRGHVPVRNPLDEEHRLIISEAQRLRSRRFGTKRIPRGGWNDLIEQATENIFFELGAFHGDIDKEKIHNALTRGKK